MTEQTECIICYELTTTSGLCHIMCPPCFNKLIQYSKQHFHRTAYCPYCREIIKHVNDARNIIYCGDCNQNVLCSDKEIVTNLQCYNKQKEYEEYAICYIRQLFKNTGT